MASKRLRVSPSLKLYFDGIKNKHGVGCGWIVNSTCPDIPTACGWQYFGNSPELTNNVAEFRALLCALQYVECQLPKTEDTKKIQLEIFGDSQVVINILTGKNQCWVDHLIVFVKEIKSILNSREFAIKTTFTMEHVKRDLNKIADYLSKVSVNNFVLNNETMGTLIFDNDENETMPEDGVLTIPILKAIIGVPNIPKKPKPKKNVVVVDQ